MTVAFVMTPSFLVQSKYQIYYLICDLRLDISMGKLTDSRFASKDDQMALTDVPLVIRAIDGEAAAAGRL
jgi:hypothetical protein